MESCHISHQANTSGWPAVRKQKPTGGPKSQDQVLWKACFAYAGPTVWNRLPASLRGHDLTLSAFKRDLKTFLFDLPS